MKSIKIVSILFSAFFILGLSSCHSHSGHNHSSDTHVHDDGTVHGDHAGDSITSTKQESFKVEADSAIQQVEEIQDHGHDHSDPNHKH